jgi:hypothetical protein
MKALLTGILTFLGLSGAAQSAPKTYEEQMSFFKELGFELNPGISEDEFLYSFNKEQYEESPISLMLFVFGIDVEREPWGRPLSNNAVNLDFEAIDDEGSYTEFFSHLARVAAQLDSFTVLSETGYELPEITITYKLGDRERVLEAMVNSDWADITAIDQFIADLEANDKSGRRFWGSENGQARIFMMLTDQQASAINTAKPGLLFRILKK